MTRRKQRAYGRNGLFEFVPHAPGIADVPDDNPLTRGCPACNVGAGQPCRRPVPRRGWVDLKDGYHAARTLR